MYQVGGQPDGLLGRLGDGPHMSGFDHVEDFHTGFEGPRPRSDFLEYRLTHLGMIHSDQ
jgi:hypothetical protein